jgi:hypothetical protein
MAKGTWLKVFENRLKSEDTFFITEITALICPLPIAIRLFLLPCCLSPYAFWAEIS